LSPKLQLISEIIDDAYYVRRAFANAMLGEVLFVEGFI
jgi:hypothetical protein